MDKTKAESMEAFGRAMRDLNGEVVPPQKRVTVHYRPGSLRCWVEVNGKRVTFKDRKAAISWGKEHEARLLWRNDTTGKGGSKYAP